MSSAGEVLFAFAASVALAAAVATVMLRSPLRAAMSLLVHIIALAGIFLTLHAHLLAALQLLVYAGAVVVLFVFVIMLIGPQSGTPPREQRGVVVRVISLALMGIVTAFVAFTVVRHEAPYVAVAQCQGQPECGQFGGVAGLGGEIYRTAIVPFELISILLLVAILGAIAVARGRSAEEEQRLRAQRKSARAREAEQDEVARRLSAEVSAHGGH